MLKSPILHKTELGYCSEPNDTNWLEDDPEDYDNWWWFCEGTMRRMFNIPKTAKKIQILGYTRAGNDRTEVIINEDNCEFVVDGKAICADDPTLETILAEGNGRTKWFVEVYYFEEDDD